VGYEINFSAPSGARLLQHPLYQKYANEESLDAISLTDVKNDLKTVQMDAPSAPVVAYLSWLIRCKQLVA